MITDSSIPFDQKGCGALPRGKREAVTGKRSASFHVRRDNTARTANPAKSVGVHTGWRGSPLKCGVGGLYTGCNDVTSKEVAQTKRLQTQGN